MDLQCFYTQKQYQSGAPRKCSSNPPPGKKEQTNKLKTENKQTNKKIKWQTEAL